MNTKFIFYNSFSNRSFFELSYGKRPWNIFLMITKGAFELHINGKTETINKDEIAFFPQNVYFEREIITPISFHQIGFLTDDNKFSAKLSPGKIKTGAKSAQHLTGMLNTASVNNSSADDEIYCHIVNSIIYDNYLADTCAENTNKPQDRDIQLALQYLSEHFNEKISISDLASLTHLSNTGLIWKFKKHLGCTPAQFLIRLRLENAKQLLLEGNLRINEIALSCGYSNAYYFSNAFCEHYGVCPSKFCDKMGKINKLAD